MKVGNISFLPWVKTLRLKLRACGYSVFVNWRRYWLNWRESHWDLHHICEIFKAFTSFPKLIVGMLIIIIRMLVLATNKADCEWVSFLVFWKGSRQLCVQNWKSLSSEQSRLGGPESKNNKQPLHNTTKRTPRKLFLSIQTCCSMDVFLLLCKWPPVWMLGSRRFHTLTPSAK